MDTGTTSKRRHTRGPFWFAVAPILVAGALLFGAMTSSAPAVDASPAPAHTTTGPTPPPSVDPPWRATAAAGTGSQTVLSGVPAYLWRDGCGPTSVGMVIGYYDANGYDLIAGSASTQTTAVSQAIASHDDGGGARHYEDYSLPKETGDAILPDKSEAPTGDEHASDCVADFMHTSWSVEGSPYGSSWSNMVGPAFVDYVSSRLSGVTATYQDYYYSGGTSGLTFALLKQEIDAGRPMVFLVDSSYDDGVTDHAVAVIGYRELDGTPQYACWDTWYTSVRWEDFHGLSSSDPWGVWGCTSFFLGGEGGIVDTTAPVSSVSGADGLWHRNPVSLVFTATDAGSGVDRIETEVDQGVWSSFSTLPGELTISGQGVHTVAYRAVDLSGNVEAANTCSVKIDAEGPVTSARRASGRKGSRITLRYKVDDLTPQATVKLVVKKRSATRARVRPGLQGTGLSRSVRWRCRLPRGVYRYFVYAKDQAGNAQKVLGSARLVVR